MNVKTCNARKDIISECVESLYNEGIPCTLRFTMNFIFGLILAPWNNGSIFIVILFLLFEVYNASSIKLKYTPNIIATRLSYLCFTIVGWIVGRVLIGDSLPVQGIYTRDKREGDIINTPTGYEVWNDDF